MWTGKTLLCISYRYALSRIYFLTCAQHDVCKKRVTYIPETDAEETRLCAKEGKYFRLEIGPRVSLFFLFSRRNSHAGSIGEIIVDCKLSYVLFETYMYIYSMYFILRIISRNIQSWSYYANINKVQIQ